MRQSLKEYIQTSKQPLNESSLIGKGFALGQNRAHAGNKNKFQSVLSRIQSNARKGLTEEDSEKRFDLIFTLFFDLAAALKIASEMSTNSINVSTAGVLDTESIKAELKRAFPRSIKR